MAKRAPEVKSDCIFCYDCNHNHGPLYVCPSYPADLRRQLIIASHKLQVNLRDSKWVKAQGLAPIDAAVFRLFAGIGEE